VRLTFEGNTLSDVLDQIESMMKYFDKMTAEVSEELPASPVQAAAVEKPVDTPVEKPKAAKPAVSEKKLAAAAKMRAAKEAKANARKAVKEVAIDTAAMMEQPPPPKSAEGMDPAEVVRVRQKTIEELQKAYANGFHREVRELLARFGNGAKSFRELPPESFVPIREAIDNGALT
jgi:hypothetical protein